MTNSKFDTRTFAMVRWAACGFGSGWVPYAPGTAGTALAIPIYLLLSVWPVWAYLGLVALLFLIGVWICDRTTRAYGVQDHHSIVWDEMVGYLVTMLGAPTAGIGWALLGFVLFRVFDIAKPWPVRQLDRRVEGGLGIMLDDVAAAVYAGALLAAIGYGWR